MQIKQQSNLYQSISQQKDWLKFTSPNDYDQLISDPKALSLKQQEIGFKARTKASARKATNEDDIPETLAQVLNKDNVVQIGKWVIRLDFENKLVTVIDEQNINSLYTKLINNEPNESIYKFTFDDEVLMLLENGYTNSNPNGRIGIFCGGGISGEGNDAQYSKYVEFSRQAVSGSVASRIDYDKFGIYFECDFVILSLPHFVSQLCLEFKPLVGTQPAS